MPGHARALVEVPPSSTELAAAARVAHTLGRTTRQVRWHHDAPGGRALVVHTPWSRVVVARTASGAQRWARGFQTGHPHGTALRAALEGVYSQVAADWGNELEVSQARLPAKLRSFISWSFGSGQRHLWPLGVYHRARWGVIGAWSSWSDAVLLVRQTATETTFQVRAGPWLDLAASPPPE